LSKHILITGGAGFIGSHLADELLEHGYRVRALDNLCRQVHGPDPQRPGYLHDEVELVVGNVCNPEAVRRALQGVDAVYHFAARVGVGQSMYRVADYTRVNNLGTAELFEALMERPVERLIVASSMSIYGEGFYRLPDGTACNGAQRTLAQLGRGEWELRNDSGEILTPIPTPETKHPSLASVYALSKYDQERMCMMLGEAYGIPTVALRFFNVYGPRQALSNPYTGVLAIFSSRYLNGKPPLIFEDGQQQRDFVNVHDIATACRLALEEPAAAGKVFNLGSGQHYSIGEIAQRMARVLGMEHVQPEITGKYRVGDIRHCFADIGLARRVLGYEPRCSLEEGLVEMVQWLQRQSACDYLDRAAFELAVRGLTV
jgi:dTDP-L-rhamnose 4-epimerase